MKKIDKGVFFTAKEDGTLTDKGFADEMIEDEDRIREELIKNGIIKNIVLVRNREKPSGVFITTDDEGLVTDKGISDDMLDNEQSVHKQLVDLGVIKQFVGYYEGPPKKPKNKFPKRKEK